MPKRIATIMLLLLLPVLYFLPALLGKIGLLDGDGWQYALGLRLLVARLVAHGTWPLWNPYTFGGMPLLATLQVGALNPLNWLFAWLPPGAAAKLMLIAFFQLALSGAYLYGRSLKLNRAAALITGLSFAFSGFMLAHIEHTVILASAVWLPWVLAAVERLRSETSWRWIAVGAGCLALQITAGHPQPVFYSCMVVGAYAVFMVATAKQRWRCVVALTVMFVGGALLSAPQWLPTLELLRQGERAAVSYEFFSSFAMPPRRLLALVFPYFFGGYGLAPYHQPAWDAWWESKWVCGYGGLLSLLLCGAAFSGARRWLAWFWMCVALMGLALAMGPHLSAGFDHLLFRVPGYNLFRCPYRNLYEFSFALAALAGLGADALVRMERAQALRIVRRSVCVLIAMVATTTFVYCFFAAQLNTPTPPPLTAGSLRNAEAWLPWLMLLVSSAALWFYAKQRTVYSSGALVAALLLDLASFGQFSYWRILNPHLTDRLADPPTVQFIKQREADLNSFRIVSHSKGGDADMLDSANVSIARGLQSVNGYDPMRLPSFADLAGQISMFGVLQDLDVYGAHDQSLNLLNSKYLLYERNDPDRVYDGVGFSQFNLDVPLTPGAHAEFQAYGVTATELALVTTMSNATHLPDGTPVARVTLHTTDGRELTQEVQAGRDTTEWAYDRADVRAVIKQRRPPVVENSPAEGFEAHRYLARLPIERSAIERVEFEYARQDASLLLVRASLYDAPTQTSTPLDPLALPRMRWQRLAGFAGVDVYENLQVRPRAWFVQGLAVVPRAEVLRAIKQGTLADGTTFDPAALALLEGEDVSTRALPAVNVLTDARVTVIDYAPQRIELAVQTAQAGFLVLSETFYPGWEARVDGTVTELYRTDYNLRGIFVPPNTRRVVFTYRAPLFRAGLWCAVGGLVLLLGGAGFKHWRAQKTVATYLGRYEVENEGGE